jgi:outer membrane protein TolC
VSESKRFGPVLRGALVALAVLVATSALPGGGARAAEGVAPPTRMQHMANVLGAGDAAMAAERAAAEADVDRLVARALATHPALAAERARAEASAASTDVARGAYHPQIGLNAQAGDARRTDLEEGGGTARSETRGVGLTLRQNLWRGGQDALAVERAQADERIAALGREGKGLEISYAVRRAALQFNHAAMARLLAEESAKDADELQRLSEKKFGAGQVGKIDVHTASMRSTSAKAQAARASITEHEAELALQKAMGGGPDGLAATKEDMRALRGVALAIPATKPALDEKLPDPLQSQRAALVQEKATAALSGARRSRWAPALDFTATAGQSMGKTTVSGGEGGAGGDPTAAPGSGDSTDSRERRVDLGLELTWPLWARPKDHQIRVAALEKSAAEADAKAATTAMALEVETVRLRLADLYDALPLYRQSWEEAGRLYDAQLRLYDAGAIDVFTVTEADSRRLEALRAWYDAVNDVRLTLLRWQGLTQGYVASAAP